MTNSSIFRSAEARETVRAWFATFKAENRYPTESFVIETSFGMTHGLEGGSGDGHPLLVLHGAMASSAHVLRELSPLLAKRRVIALDVIGQSPMSEDRRLDLNDDSYGRWLAEVCEQRGLEQLDLLGVSWGGFVAVKSLPNLGVRVRKLVLLVPAGFVQGPFLKGLFKVGFPISKQLRNPSRENLRKVTDAIFTVQDPVWEEYFGVALANYRLDVRVPPIWKAVAFSGPVLAFGADEDLSFPGEALLRRIKELMPSAQTVLLKNCKHCPPTTDEFRADLSRQIEAFLAQN
jgi:2-hydroxy-6-oxonona-2,4-dienedioate hydrolase